VCAFHASCLNMQVMRETGLLGALARMDGTFAWPERYQMMAICRQLQVSGCCALTFQRAATAFFMSRCAFSEALQTGMLSARCKDLGAAPFCMCNAPAHAVLLVDVAAQAWIAGHPVSTASARCTAAM
jgi:hypothetical protein